MFHTSLDDVERIHSELLDLGVPYSRLLADERYWYDGIRKQVESEQSHDLYLDMFVNWYLCFSNRIQFDKDKTDKQKVYLAHANEDVYKIGKSMNPEQRIQRLNTASPVFVGLYTDFKTDNATKCESFLHGLFKDGRKKGEWFNLFDCEVDAINTIDIAIGGRFYPNDMFTPLMQFVDDINDIFNSRKISFYISPVGVK